MGICGDCENVPPYAYSICGGHSAIDSDGLVIAFGVWVRFGWATGYRLQAIALWKRNYVASIVRMTRAGLPAAME